MISSWMLLVTFLTIVSTDQSESVCTNTEKCNCISKMNGNYEYQCPPLGMDSKTVINIYPRSNKIRIDCNEAEFLNQTYLPKAGFGNITKLELQACPVPENGFEEILENFNITNLQHLSFTQYSIDLPLTNKDFQNFEPLTMMALRNTNITVLDKIIFKETPNLNELELSHNQINLYEDTFENIPNLLVLLLDSNNISYIPRKTFNHLRNLTQLGLWMNNLENLDKGVFDYLENLKLLELSQNKIKSFDKDVFKDLKNLKAISLNRNYLNEISRILFENCENIEWIRLDSNPGLVLVGGVFSNFTHLKKVNLASNRLEYLPENLFSESTNLKDIWLDFNQIKNLPRNIFKGLSNMVTLKLSHNKIHDLDADIFSSLVNLQYLHLQHNDLESLSETLLHRLTNLKEINLDFNKISRLSSNFLSRNDNLLKFSMNHNAYDFDEMSEVTPFSTRANMKELDLSFNKISWYPYELHSIVSFRDIKLQHNRIQNIVLDYLTSLNTNGLSVNLEFNEISRIDLANIDSSVEQSATSAVIKISHNPIFCDCHALNITKFIQESYGVKNNLKLERMILNCAGPLYLRGKSLDEVRVRDLSCPLHESCTKTGECSCKYRPSDKTISIDCAERNLNSVPELDLSAISSKYGFVDYERTEVHLEENMLERCPGEHDGYNNITKLYLHGNRIRNITWLPPSLKVLDLRNNRLKTVSNTSLQLLKQTKLEEVYLSNNSWSCECELKEFNIYLKEHLKQVDYQDIRCDGTGTKLIQMNDKDLCPTKRELILYLLVIVFFITATGALSISLYYKYHKEILIWLYARGLCLWIIKEEELDMDKLYDAFVCFSHKDENFVTQELVPVLESGEEPYSLCIHVRDFIPGELIHSQITKSVKESRRTIVVLSSNFLESVWGKVEFRTAHSEAMIEGRARVIIIIYGDLDMEKLDDDFKAYLRTNTYIKWGDPWFWDKMRYALPKRNRRRANSSSKKHANMMQFIDEKFQSTGVQLVSKPTIVLNPGNLEECSLTSIIA